MLDAALDIARGLAEREPVDAPVLVLGHPSISRGIVGLVAARLAELYGKPAFVYEQGEDGCVGSARGIEGFDVVSALNRADDLLARHGGHKAAGGFALRVDAASAFRERLWQAAHEQRGADPPRQELRIDTSATLPELDRKVLALHGVLRAMRYRQPGASAHERARRRRLPPIGGKWQTPDA